MLARHVDTCASICRGDRVRVGNLDRFVLRRGLRGDELPDPDSDPRHPGDAGRDRRGRGRSPERRVRDDAARARVQRSDLERTGTRSSPRRQDRGRTRSRPRSRSRPSGHDPRRPGHHAVDRLARQAVPPAIRVSPLRRPEGCREGNVLARIAADFTRGVYGDNTTSSTCRPRTRRRSTPAASVAADADLTRVYVRHQDDQAPRGHRLAARPRARDRQRRPDRPRPDRQPPRRRRHRQGRPVRHAIGGLNALADELGNAIIGVRHLTKATPDGALAAVLGSTAWLDLPAPFSRSLATTKTRSSTGRWSPATDPAAAPPAVPHRTPRRRPPRARHLRRRDGASSRTSTSSLRADKRRLEAQTARDLILDILEEEGGQESDQLDARIARETDLTARRSRTTARTQERRPDQRPAQKGRARRHPPLESHPHPGHERMTRHPHPDDPERLQSRARGQRAVGIWAKARSLVHLERVNWTIHPLSTWEDTGSGYSRSRPLRCRDLGFLP